MQIELLIEGNSALAGAGSALPQSNDGVDPHRAARGDIAGRKRHDDEDSCETDKVRGSLGETP